MVVVLRVEVGRQGISIGENSIVGMGSLLIRSIKAGSTTLQLPSRVLKKSEKI
jgi:serine acetyltransferase